LGLIFAAVLIWYGWRLSANTLRMGQASPAMRLPVGYIYMVIPAAGGMMALRYLLVLASLVKTGDYVPPHSDIKNS
ncbi:MAG: TRAP transporter small permease subunit, partial [Paracoccus sp. (in: a-proteobacteria)]|uniref:TRAP transporter small permease n=1 Tax=Paracoccus sp. TaxID=267 RepID=UPI0026DEEFF1